MLSKFQNETEKILTKLYKGQRITTIIALLRDSHLTINVFLTLFSGEKNTKFDVLQFPTKCLSATV